MRSFIALIFIIFFVNISLYAQDTAIYKLRIDVPLADFPQNISLPNHYPSMYQSMEYSGDFYELSFWGIDALGDKIFKSKNKPYTKWRKNTNNAFKYALGLGFSKYGSELPIPLGVWAHEEFHRTVLGVVDIKSKNGNWLFSRWDGTVYGISDETLDMLKSTNPDQLLFSYVSGVQYEILLNEKVTLSDFYYQRNLNKNALLLYNAYYVYNYFRFSTSFFTDSVKILAPPHENILAEERDFAGADLTAWVYDMYNPELPFTSRDSFPNGDGVNRRVGFSDLTSEAQDFLKKQKKMSLLNFLNPGIFFVNRIKINQNLSFNLFAQYSPTHFGNDIGVFLPFRYKKFNLLVNWHSYNGRFKRGSGIGFALFDYKLNEKFRSDIVLNVWNQPVSFGSDELRFGGALGIVSRYAVTEKISGYISFNGKTDGWLMGNPYLNSNCSVQFGLNYYLKKL